MTVVVKERRTYAVVDDEKIIVRTLGVPGPPGPPGADGIQGPSGDDGLPGSSVTFVGIDGDGDPYYDPELIPEGEEATIFVDDDGDPAVSQESVPSIKLARKSSLLGSTFKMDVSWEHPDTVVDWELTSARYRVRAGHIELSGSVYIPAASLPSNVVNASKPFLRVPMDLRPLASVDSWPMTMVYPEPDFKTRYGAVYGPTILSPDIWMYSAIQLDPPWTLAPGNGVYLYLDGVHWVIDHV